MLFFKKKKKSEESDSEGEEGEETQDEEGGGGGGAAKASQPEKVPDSGGDISLPKISADVEKLKAQFSTFYELQKATTERFTRVNEQIGELRSMMIQRDKDSQFLEAKATQAIDLVKTVQPEKLMIEVKKEDSKVEALKANLESNEGVMKNILGELKQMRNKINMFKGMEQIVNLNEEVKKELMSIKKVSALVERHADKVETIFSEFQKRYSEFVKTQTLMEDLDKSTKKAISDVDSVKVKIADLSSKKEMENLIVKVENFEKHASGVIAMIDNKFEKQSKDFDKDYKMKMTRTEQLLKGFETLAQKTPDLDKYFNLLTEEAKKVAVKKKEGEDVEKVKQPGEISAPVKTEEKEGLFSKIRGKFARS